MGVAAWTQSLFFVLMALRTKLLHGRQIMCSPSIPSAPPAPPPPPQQQDPAVVAARNSEQLRQRQAASNTILTGPQGVTAPATTAVKTLLGQ
jgi:hypothetical protein